MGEGDRCEGEKGRERSGERKEPFILLENIVVKKAITFQLSLNLLLYCSCEVEREERGGMFDHSKPLSCSVSFTLADGST